MTCTPPDVDISGIERSDTLSWEHELAGGVDRSASYLVCALQCERPMASAVRIDLSGARLVSIGRASTSGDAVAAVSRPSGAASVRIDVPDQLMSRDHAALLATGSGWVFEDRGSKNGSAVNGVAARRVRLVDGDVVEVGGTSFVYRTGQPAARADDVAAVTRAGAPVGMSTLSTALAAAFSRLRGVAGHDVPVLITGETGTGKELVARAVHAMSGRSGRLVAINCGAVTPSLIESEMFGHEAGAFSGADSARDGLIRRADGGTVLLDEVAELPESCQASLLRVLQEGEVRPVGSNDAHAVDVRFVAATHQDLEAAVEAGRFRRDLYARLAGFRFMVPPLRQRREDIGALIAVLLSRVAGDNASRIRLSRAAMRGLMNYGYPLNVRELEHALAAAAALTGAGCIELHHLPAGMTPAVVDPALSSQDRELRTRVIAQLTEHRGNVSAVARAMDKAPIQIRRWCKRLGIDIERFRG